MPADPPRRWWRPDHDNNVPGYHRANHSADDNHDHANHDLANDDDHDHIADDDHIAHDHPPAADHHIADDDHIADDHIADDHIADHDHRAVDHDHDRPASRDRSIDGCVHGFRGGVLPCRREPQQHAGATT